MKLTETVAKFIYNSMRLSSIMGGKTNMREQAAIVGEYIQCSHPQQNITVQASLSVGDVLEPLTESLYIFNGDPQAMEYDDKLLVYSISCPQQDTSLPLTTETGIDLPIKATIILVRYRSSTIDFDLSKIVSVMCVSQQIGLYGLLTGFKLLGNIRSRMD